MEGKKRKQKISPYGPQSTVSIFRFVHLKLKNSSKLSPKYILGTVSHYSKQIKMKARDPTLSHTHTCTHACTHRKGPNRYTRMLIADPSIWWWNYTGFQFALFYFVYQSWKICNKPILLLLGQKWTHPKSCFHLGKKRARHHETRGVKTQARSWNKAAA